MKRLLKVAGWLIFTLAFLYLAGGLVYMEMTGGKLMAELEGLKKAGHPMTIAAADPKPPENENAAPVYDLVLKKLEKVSADDLKKLKAFCAKPAPGLVEIQVILTQHKSAIDELASADGKSRYWIADPFTAPLPNFALAFDVLQARCLHAAINGQDKAALKDFRTILSVGHNVRQGPFMLHPGFGSLFVESIENLLPHLKLAADDWKALAALADPSTFDKHRPRMLALELIASVGDITGIRPLDEKLSAAPGRRFLFPLRNHVALAYVRYWKDYERLIREPYPKSKSALAELSQTAAADPLIPMMTPMVSIHFQTHAEAAALHRARVHMVRIALDLLASGATSTAEVNAFTGEPWKVVTKDGLWIDGGHDKLRLRLR